MSNLLYLVTFDGLRDQYGSEIYLGGIFDSEDKAKDCANKIESSCVDVKITPVTINHEYPISKQSNSPTSFDVCSGIYLGGYVE